MALQLQIDVLVERLASSPSMLTHEGLDALRTAVDAFSQVLIAVGPRADGADDAATITLSEALDMAALEAIEARLAAQADAVTTLGAGLTAAARDADTIGEALSDCLVATLDAFDEVSQAAIDSLEALLDGLTTSETMYGAEVDRSVTTPFDRNVDFILNALGDQADETLRTALLTVRDLQVTARDGLQVAVADLVQALLELEQSAQTQLASGVDQLTRRAAEAITNRALNVLASELQQAGVSVAVGTALQCALVTGPWITAIHAAKVAMDTLP
ncbi:hypothetical protein [Xanthobacter versatilis]|uniref:hypothetical protein n=1 Tax=Xanthobacter autotrophicus (strain ATCC BAA-1158 / Py2) TaxID=78245 RepID=UPI00372B6678